MPRIFKQNTIPSEQKKIISRKHSGLKEKQLISRYLAINKLDFLKTVYSLIGKCRARSGHPQVIQYRSWNLSRDRPRGQQ